MSAACCSLPSALPLLASPPAVAASGVGLPLGQLPPHLPGSLPASLAPGSAQQLMAARCGAARGSGGLGQRIDAGSLYALALGAPPLSLASAVAQALAIPQGTGGQVCAPSARQPSATPTVNGVSW